MQWNLNLICETLNASVQTIKGISHDMYMLEFNDNNFKFNLQVQPEIETIIVAADSSEPKGMPLFEYSCNCNIIKVIDSPYSLGTKAIYFYENKDFDDGVRLAFNLRPDKNWYIWCNIWKESQRHSSHSSL